MKVRALTNFYGRGQLYAAGAEIEVEDADDWIRDGVVETVPEIRGPESVSTALIGSDDEIPKTEVMVPLVESEIGGSDNAATNVEIPAPTLPQTAGPVPGGFHRRKTK